MNSETSIRAAMAAHRSRELAEYARGASIIVLMEHGKASSGAFGMGVTAYGHSAEKLLPFVPTASPEVQHWKHGEEFIDDEVHELRLSSRVCTEVLEKASAKHRIAVVDHDGWDKPFFTVAVIPKQSVQVNEPESEFDFGL